MIWDPAEYLRFADHRLRPGVELLARVPPIEPARVIDLGCGPGNLTALVAARFPGARVSGLDSSAEMLAEARATHPALEWVQADIADWSPDVPYGLIFSNATLHWLDAHDELFPRLAGSVGAGGVLAVQMPDNWSESVSAIPAQVLDEGGFASEIGAALPRDRVATPTEYREWIGPGFDIDMWTTTYHQVLGGEDPVLEWVTGALLRPVLDALGAEDRTRFLRECAIRYRAAYPAGPDGSTILPFRRLFIVARRR